MDRDNMKFIRDKRSVSYGIYDSWLERAFVLGEDCRFQEALHAYEKALELNPGDSYVWFEKGLTLLRLDRWEEALMVFDKILELNPEDSNAWYAKGSALYGIGRYEDALQAYQKALLLTPHLFQVWGDMATSLCKLGRFAEAVHAYEKAFDLAPDDFCFLCNINATWNDIATALCKLCRFEEALQYYEKALELNPDDAEAIYGKGTALGNLKRYEEMQMAFEKTSELNMVSENNFTMKNYSIEELQNANLEELIEIGKAFVKGKLQLTDEKMKILYDQTILVTNRVNYIDEVMTTPGICNPSNYAEIRETLEKAFQACDRDDWISCRSALEVFFEWEANQDLNYLDVSAWNYQHILRWWLMLFKTDLRKDKSVGSPVKILSNKINHQFFSRMPEHAKPKLEEGIKKFFPKLHYMFKNSNIYTEDGKKGITTAEAAEALDMSEDEIIDALSDDDGKSLLTDDETYTLI